MKLLNPQTPVTKDHLQKKKLEIFSNPLYLDNFQPSQGNLNYIRAYTDVQGRKYLLRLENPQGRRKELPFITAEFEHVRFLSKPGHSFKLRTIPQQAEISRRIKALGIVTPEIYCFTDKLMLLELYEDAIHQADLWQKDPHKAEVSTVAILDWLVKIHNHDIVLGDRWGKNELILPDGTISFVDFDIELSGSQTKEFELSMFIYFNAYFAQLNPDVSFGNLLDIYVDLFKKLENHNLDEITNFVSNFCNYFGPGTLYAWRKQSNVNQFQAIL